jgi:hypothetical protein
LKEYGLWNIVFEVPKECELFGNAEVIGKIPEVALGRLKLFLQSVKEHGWVTEKELICIEE